MNELERALTPEEQELLEKERELSGLESVLAQKELELATLAGEVTSFHIKYLRAVEGTVHIRAEIYAKR